MEATGADMINGAIVANGNSSGGGGGGWKTVSYGKKQKKKDVPKNGSSSSSMGVVGGDNNNNNNNNKVFRSLEKQSEERRKKIEAQRAAAVDLYDDDDDDKIRSRRRKVRSDEDDEEDESDENGAADAAEEEENPKAAAKKKKKEKKPKVSVSEASSKIVSDDLASFLAEITVSFESQHGIQLMRFADYFGRAFSTVPASQFPWTKMFRESTVAKIADIPVNHISEDVYKTSVDWISKQPVVELQTFVIWGLDSILVEVINQLGTVKGSKKSVQPSSKSQVAIFVVLAMVLRRKPDALIGVLSILRENPKYQGQEKLPVIVWMITQACHGDLGVGLYAWAHNLLPMVVSKSCNPQSRDLILQLVERILSGPKARTILVNGAVRKGERLLPPVAFDMLMRVTFPASSARVKATERFEAIYPTLKEVALAGSTGSKAMKQVSQQIMTLAVKAAGEGNPELSNEATSVFTWCLTENSDCYKQWDKVYMDSVAASVAVLKKITQGWKEFSVKQSSSDALREAVKSFRHQNETALANEEDHARQSLFKEADKYCKMIAAKQSRGVGCVKVLGIAMILIGVGIVVAPNIEETFNLGKLSELFAEKFL